MKRGEVLQRLVTSIGGDTIRVVSGEVWPSRCEVWDGSSWRSCAFYVGVVGPSGRRPDEMRMQNPVDAPPIESIPGHTALLFGLWVDDAAGDVLVCWDVARRVGRDTRFSMFVPLATIQQAQADGRAHYTSTNDERVRAFSVASLGNGRFVDIIDTGGQVPMVDEEELDAIGDAENKADLDALAEKLATLSEGQTPNTFTRAPLSFSAADVDWATNDWVARVCEVQEWLRLEDSIDSQAGAAEVLRALFTMLGDGEPNRCFLIEEGHARLTDDGVSVLGTYLDAARTHRDSFSQAVDEGVSVGEATRVWNESWEETPVSVEEAQVAVHARVETWQICQFRDRAKEQGLDLNPSYQRGNVWSDKESCELIDSILRGIPLPSIILNQRAGQDSLEIVDGKQRLTAILRFIQGHPDALAFAKRVAEENDIDVQLFHENYKKWRAKVRKRRGLTGDEERSNFLPYPYRLPKASRSGDPLASLNGLYYFEMKERTVQIQGRLETIKKVFELPFTAYKLSIILYEDTDIHQIHKVFGLYNRQGKKLNATEVRNAIYHHLALARLLLLLAGDSDDIKVLAPYLTESEVDLPAIRELLQAMNVSDSRFNRTKITSWVTAILLHRLDTRPGVISSPGSTSLIEAMMVTIADAKGHPMSKEAACASFARALCSGASLLSALKNQEAFAPSFTHPEKWEDLPAVAAWTACTLAAIAGVTIDERTRAAVLSVTRRTGKLEKQQARSQWEWVARFVLTLLAELQVDTTSLGAMLEKRFGNNCVQTLELRRA